MGDFQTHCLVCGSPAITAWPRYRHIHLMRCSQCRFVFSGKIPSTQELLNLYSSYGRNDYLSPITIKRFHEILDGLEPVRQTNRMLDVGCGIGYFLAEAAKRKWEVYGTEFTPEAVEICRGKGINMQEGSLNPAHYAPESFDVIISIEVIEHINHPREEVQKFARLLRPGGVVYLTTPNFNSVSRKILHEKWNVLSYPEHLCYYTPKTLTRLFAGFGFRREKIKTTGVSITRLRSSATGIAEVAVAAGSQDEKLRRKFESSFLLQRVKSVVNGLLNLTGTGDHLKATMVKR
jgi:2-polyprenyl-3-methyl-5-hydroxy-6-metoxy-1,4-benzoquinol methylase